MATRKLTRKTDLRPRWRVFQWGGIYLRNGDEVIWRGLRIWDIPLPLNTEAFGTLQGLRDEL